MSDSAEKTSEVTSEIEEDKSIRGVSLRGSQGAFCAGADLKDFKNNFSTPLFTVIIKPKMLILYTYSILSM